MKEIVYRVSADHAVILADAIVSKVVDHVRQLKIKIAL